MLLRRGWLARSPRNRRDVLLRLERLQVRHELPDRVGRQDAPERRHPPRPAVIDRVEHLPVSSAVAPPPIREARAHEPHRPPPLTAVPVEQTEELLTILRRRPV